MIRKIAESFGLLNFSNGLLVPRNSIKNGFEKSKHF